MYERRGDGLQAPELAHVCDVIVEVGEPRVVGQSAHGMRRVVPIIGGTATGDRLSGRVMSTGGADHQIVKSDRVSVHARYAIETPTGSLVHVENVGLRIGPPDVLARLLRGEHVDPSTYYFRSTPSFRTDDPDYRWLENRLFVATGVRLPTTVVLAFFEVC